MSGSPCILCVSQKQLYSWPELWSVVEEPQILLFVLLQSPRCSFVAIWELVLFPVTLDSGYLFNVFFTQRCFVLSPYVLAPAVAQQLGPDGFTLGKFWQGFGQFCFFFCKGRTKMYPNIFVPDILVLVNLNILPSQSQKLKLDKFLPHAFSSTKINPKRPKRSKFEIYLCQGSAVLDACR